MESKTAKLTETIEWWLPGAGRWEKWEDIHQRVQNSNYKINKYGDLMYCKVITVNTTLYT